MPRLQNAICLKFFYFILNACASFEPAKLEAGKKHDTEESFSPKAKGVPTQSNGESFQQREEAYGYAL